MVEEFKKCLALAKHVMETLGLQNDVTYVLAKWNPENRAKYIGDAQVWEETQEHIRQMLKELEIPFVEEVGGAAFYGPKVDINAKNVYGKEDTMITVQWDPLLAEQFDMYYVDQNGEKVRPYIIHRTSMGCYERTLAWLIEKYEGKFPTWLCPEQVRILPISEKYGDYAYEVAAELKKNGVLVHVDNRSEKIGYKIRDARNNRVPYMLVLGQQEEADRTVAVRSRFAGDEGVKPIAEFVQAICEEIRTKTIRKIEVVEQQ
jgi:threonyl-tRNA synthetase